jgi:hypothetical protein
MSGKIWLDNQNQNKSKNWLPGILCIFLTQITNFNQFRQGEVW